MNTLASPRGPVRPIERTSRRSGGPVDFDMMRRRSWPGVSAECVRLAAPTEYDFQLKPSSNFLVLLDLNRADGETEVPGAPRTYRKNLRHRLSFVPKGAEICGWSRILKPASFTAVYFDSDVLGERGRDLSQLPPMVEFEDAMQRTAMRQFDAIVNDPQLDQPGYAETLAILLAFEISRHHDRGKRPAATASGLTQWQVRTVTDYVEGRLNDNTTIADLSALLDLSRFHFIRAFKKAVGMPPHRYIMHRRIERARELLANRDLSVGEIAERAGFSGSAQLTRAFRNIAGTTPTAFRREM